MGLTGPLPTELAMLPQLSYLRLPYNELTGSIPVEVVKRCQNLKDLNLQSNKLEGTIPPELFSSPNNVMYFSFTRNQLTGTLPVAIQSYKGGYLSFSYNLLTGTLPEDLFLLTNLRSLDLSGNYVSYAWLPRSISFPEPSLSQSSSYPAHCQRNLARCRICFSC